MPDIVAKVPHAFSPIKAGAVYPDEQRPIQRSGINSAGFPLAPTAPFYEPKTNAGRNSVSNEQYFTEQARKELISQHGRPKDSDGMSIHSSSVHSYGYNPED